MCYNKNVHKPFYVSGFLYHLRTQQILLHQPNLGNNSPSIWAMPGGAGIGEEDPQKSFQRVIYQLLNLRLDEKCIYPVYDYFNDALNTIHYVFYAKVKTTKNLSLPDNGVLSWFSFKQITKLPFSEQAKQDIIVSQRVIQAQARSDLGITPDPRAIYKT